LKIKFLAIGLGLILTLTLSLCKQGAKRDDDSATVFRNHHDTVKYMGTKSCEPCHSDKYKTFLETGMGKSFDLASLEKTSGNFKHVVPVYDSSLDMFYLPFFKDQSFYLKEYRMKGKDTVYSRTEKISYIIGSGHHTNSHFIEENGYVFQAPITFYTQKGKWDLPPGFENGNNTRFSRKIGMECMSCHNALPPYVEGSDNRYDELPHGISCERCHGPGQIHIQEMQKGRTTTPYTIVNPADIPWPRQIDICQRCHLQGNAVLKPGKTFASFRPGMVLSETFDQFSPVYEGGEDFVMAAHAERFQMSECFVKSVKGDLNSGNAKIGFTCISCHDPHVSVRNTNNEHFNNTCKSCHSGQQVKCSDTKEHLEAAGNNCVKCHMPSSGTIDIPHVTVHEHYIRKPKPQVKNTGKLVGLRCITNKNPDILTETRAYISYFEKFDPHPLYLQKAKKKSEDLDEKQAEHLKTLVHLYYISKDYPKIISLIENKTDSYDAWTAYRVAKAYEHGANLEKSMEWFEKVLDKEPGNLDFLLQYSVILIKTKQYRKAEEMLDKLNKLYSKNAESWAYLGMVKLQANELVLAKQYFLKALALDPDLMVALQNLKNLYQFTGNAEEVKKLEDRIQRKNGVIR
jgi:Tfp pilus assembly protein PilF